jgi:hypothetical protein
MPAEDRIGTPETLEGDKLMAKNTIYRCTIYKITPVNFPAVSFVQGNHGRVDPSCIICYSWLQSIWGSIKF